MFHVKQHTKRVSSRRPTWLIAAGLLPLALLVSACGAVASPDGWASPTVQDGRILLANDDNLFSYDIESLLPQWRFPPQGEDVDIDAVALYGDPAVTQDAVYIPTYDGELYAVDAETGDLLWGGRAFETDGPIIGGITLDQGTLYFGSSDGNVYAVNAEDGQQRWAFETGGEVWAAPAVAEGNVFATSLDGNLYVLDAASGNLLWQYGTSAGIASPPVVDPANNAVYIAGFDRRIRAIDLESQEETWSIEAQNWFWTEPLLDSGVLYAGSLDGKVYAVDVASGDLLWTAPARGPVRAAPILVDDRLIVFNRDGDILAIDAGSGDVPAGEPPNAGGDVLANPTFIPAQDGTGEAIAVVTTGGDFLIIDPDNLRIRERRPLE